MCCFLNLLFFEILCLFHLLLFFEICCFLKFEICCFSILLLFNSVVFSDLLLLGSTLICCHQVVVAYILKYFKSRHSIKSRSCLFFKYFKSRLFSFAGGSPPCTPRRSAGGRPIGQEISKIRGGNMKQNPLKSRGLWGVRE
jgi:hypothetical protein